MGATRPRILGWRLIVVALVVGAVLAVVGVPAAAVVGALPPMSAVATTRRGHFYDDGHLILFDRAWNPASERWGGMSAPRGVHDRALWADDGGGIPLVEADPRPAFARPVMDGTVRTSTHYLAGWPWRSAWGVTTTYPLPPGDPFKGLWRPTAFGRDWSVPYLPLWPGLLANIIFYALLVLMPVVLWRWLRQRRRAKRNLCLACGYELGAGVSVCPECGSAREG